MIRSDRRSIATLVAILVAAVSFAAPAASAQAPVPASEAQAFLGNWAVALDAQGQTFVLDINIQDAGGNVAAEVSSEMGGATNVEEISKSGENLVLNYDMEAQGQQVPVEITLTAADEGLDARVDFADGMFQTTGKGTRK
ncbi:MAG: hypothetical protein WD766_10520 [Gemmatimonadota bacterium]